MSLSSNTVSHPVSYWRETANRKVRCPALANDCHVDTLVIGGGFTGLSAARDLLERGIDCLVVEGKDIGWGASGRTGGFAVPRYKTNFSTLAGRFGHDVAKDLFNQVVEAVDTVAQTVADFGIECDFQRNGHLTPAHSELAMEGLKADCDWLREVAGDEVARTLSVGDAAEMLGTSIYKGAYLDPRGACLHPYNYVCGLAEALERRGVPVHSGSPVLSLEREGSHWLARTPEASVRARCVIVATNGYSSALSRTDDLYKRIIPVASSVIVTRPLNCDERAATLPSLLPVTDTRRLVSYFRMLPSGQLLFGGRGDITGERIDPGAYRILERQMAATFPHLSGVEVTHRWSGMVAVTLDAFPHIGRQEEGLLYAIGYGGRGVALTSLMGRRLAAMAAGETLPSGPMSTGSFPPIPFHAFRRTGMRIMEHYYKIRDHLER